MPRILAALALSLLACHDPQPEQPDAFTPVPIPGTWRIEWELVDGPLGNVNPLRYSTTVEVSAVSARYWSETCPDCGGEHVGELSADESCFYALPGGDAPHWSAYSLCTGYDGMTGDITWTGYPGPPGERVWRVSAE